MKKFITTKEAMEKAFFLGSLLGFDLAGLGERVAPKVVGKSQNQIEGILKKELDAIFKRAEKQAKK